MIFTHLATVATLIRAGQLRALAVTGLHRTAAFPDIPTVAESGFPGFDVVTWHGVLLPPGTPREIIIRLHDELARILAMEDMRAQLASLGMEPVGGTPDGIRGRYPRRPPTLGDGDSRRRIAQPIMCAGDTTHAGCSGR